MAASMINAKIPFSSSRLREIGMETRRLSSFGFRNSCVSNRSSNIFLRTKSQNLQNQQRSCFPVLACHTPSTSSPKTRLFVSGLSFRTTEESLRNAFQSFGQLVEVDLVMDKHAMRHRGFAFLRYATEEESQKVIDQMHGKFLDGRVIFVEFAKPRSELRRNLDQKRRQRHARR